MPKIIETPVTCKEPEAVLLNDDQRRAFVLITRKLLAGQRVVKLTGWAGSGKTYVLVKLAEWADREGFDVSIAAPTHKAAGVIAEKLRQDGVGLEVRTIHSLLGLLLVPDMENDTGGRILTAAPLSENGDGSGDGALRPLIIVDETSMVGEVLRRHVEERTRQSNVQWLFVGDPGQLPPVGEGPSAMLQQPDVTLRKIVRQKEGSAVIKLAQRIRMGDLSMSLVGLPGCNGLMRHDGQSRDGGSVAFLQEVTQVGDAAELLEAAVKRFDSNEHRDDPSHARILVFRNARRRQFNDAIRQLLVDAPLPFVSDEWLVMYNQFDPGRSSLNRLAEWAKQFERGSDNYRWAWSAFFEEKERQQEERKQGIAKAFLHVSQEVRITNVSDSSVPMGDDRFFIWDLSVIDRDGEFHRLPILKEESRASHAVAMVKLIEDARLIREGMDLLEAQGHDASSQEWQRLDLARRRCWGKYYGLEETFAQVDYSYCSTTHKAQGSTYDHAYVDVGDLMTSGGMRQRILYTAVTRPRGTLTFCL